MKKKVLFIALVSVVSLSACNNPSQKNTENMETTAKKR